MRIFILIFFFLFQNKVNASIKSEIINNFKLTENLKFNFVQKIGKKIEKGECIIAYPKKIFCKYDERYNKILVSNGKSLVIKSDRRNQHYAYRLDKTPLNLILDKKFLINKMENSENLSNTLNQGCGCTRGQRAEAALKEYFSIGEFLDEPSLALIRAKYPSHTVEFAQDGGVFFVIEPI